MANHLAQSASLYLRKHAENPIDWWYWGTEALELAQSQDKPIFLSIGYSSCHWCTVMEQEAFSDRQIAAYMNAHFIAIKVDREERPDLDSIYMQAVHIMGEQGGWPLNLFLTPDRVPFFGGTYFPVEPRYGRPGFLQLLQAIHQAYQSRRGEIERFRAVMLEQLAALGGAQPLTDIPLKIVLTGIDRCSDYLQPKRQGTCFPMIPYANLVLRGSRLLMSQTQRMDQLCYQWGINIALGGIYDHVAGGWHRYTVDPDWTVPHFEKMLYDNGLIMEYLANLWSAGFSEPAFDRGIQNTATWLQREMVAPEGYFYASQDADSEGEEGKFWVWDYQELLSHLSQEDRELLEATFFISPQGNFEGKIVLKRRNLGALPDRIEAILLRLFHLRYGELEPTDYFPPLLDFHSQKNYTARIPPVTDPKMILSWNSLMISGLARAFQVFGKEHYWQLACGAAQFIEEHQWQGEQLHRLYYESKVAIAAQSEDYAFWIKALLDLYQCKNETKYLEAAERTQAAFDAQCGDSQGGYFNTLPSPDLLVREKSYQDNAVPSPNGVAVSNLIRLYLATNKSTYRDRGEATLKSFGHIMSQSPLACPSLLIGLDWYWHHTLVQCHPEAFTLLNSSWQPFVHAQLQPDIPYPGLVCADDRCFATPENLETWWGQMQESQSRMLWKNC